MSKVDHLETIAQAKMGGSLWCLTTSSRLSHVLTPEYFLRFPDYPLRRHDRISVSANCNEDAEYAVLIVTGVERGSVTTELWLTGSDAQL